MRIFERNKYIYTYKDHEFLYASSSARLTDSTKSALHRLSDDLKICRFSQLQIGGTLTGHEMNEKKYVLPSVTSSSATEALEGSSIFLVMIRHHDSNKHPRRNQENILCHMSRVLGANC